MDKAIQELIEQIESSIQAAADSALGDQSVVSALIDEARREALAEAKRIVRDAMARALLERVARELGARSTDVELASVEPASIEPTPVEPIPGEPAPAGPVPAADEPCPGVLRPEVSEADLWSEIDAIRSKIAANEGLLREIKAPPQEVQEPETESKADEPESREGYGYYVYGIVEGCDGSPEILQESMDPEHPVYRLDHQRLKALVSEVPLREFGKEAVKAHLEDMTWLEAKARAHQNVLEVVSTHQAVVPMRFCTIYESQEHVRDMLDERYDDLVAALERLRNKQEWGVKVYYDAKALAQQVGQRSTRVQELAAEMEQKPSGVAYFLRKQREGIVAEEVERVCAECAQQSHDRLASCVCEAAINPLQSKELTDQEDEMILNGAYLVAEEGLRDFEKTLETLRAEYGEPGFTYVMTGPWPPYNFVRTEGGDEPVGS